MKRASLVKTLMGKEVSDFKVAQTVKGYFVSFNYDGEAIKYRVVRKLKPYAPRQGSWSKDFDEVYIDNHGYNTSEIKSLAFHNAMLKFLCQKYGIDPKGDGMKVAEALEQKIAHQVGIVLQAWKMRVEMAERAA
jgi:hypothetical protein